MEPLIGLILTHFYNILLLLHLYMCFSTCRSTLNTIKAEADVKKFQPRDEISFPCKAGFVLYKEAGDKLAGTVLLY